MEAKNYISKLYTERLTLRPYQSKDGKEIFKKTYNESGIVKETIELSKKNKGILIVSLKDANRSVSKKIIIE